MAQSQLPAVQQHLNQRSDASPATWEVCAVSLVKLALSLGEKLLPSRCSAERGCASFLRIAGKSARGGCFYFLFEFGVILEIL